MLTYEDVRAVSPALEHYTKGPLHAPRDRSSVTVSALIASGQVAQITYHLGRAMGNGSATVKIEPSKA